MKIIEFGQQNSKVIILLHGGGLGRWNYQRVAQLLCPKYHVILPILDGHAGSDCNFVSIKQNAQEVIEFIDKNHNGKVHLIGGLSLG
ncbi:alpha/beta hydrolase, partial [Lactobacillus sp. XV13L]|nr:alpha/beta hydrolase [Lactobacillus sp. XV13L]